MRYISRRRPSLFLFLVTALCVLLSAHLVGCGASNMGQSGPPPKNLRSLTIDPRESGVPLGTSQQFTATAWFSDGSKSDVTNFAAWNSSQPNVATFQAAGAASTKAVGKTSISAAYQSVNGFSTLTVNSAALVSLSVGPQSPSLTPQHSIQLNATGTFTDGSTQDLTSAVTWSSGAATVVTITDSGLATAHGLGTATITASSNNINAANTMTVVPPTLDSLVITPAGTTIPLGESLQLGAIGKYNDGSTRDLTKSVAWISSNATIIGVNSSGLATASTFGGVTVTVTSGKVEFATQFQVGAPVAVAISVEPESSVVELGGNEQLKALAQFSDGTTEDLTASAIWRSLNPAIAGISAPGMVVAREIGEATISVSSEGVSGSANLTIKPVLAVTYFANAHKTGVADAIVRLTNPGLTGGNLCAEMYVFDQNQELSECCGCLVSPNGLLTLSINRDLTGNPLSGVKSTDGVVKLVSADVPSDNSCNPAAIMPDAKLLAWATNIQTPSASNFSTTETPFQLAPLGDDELAALQNQCLYVATLGSGQGICSCGATSSASAKR
jgi:Bacterial Ig-like domain (group 2)